MAANPPLPLLIKPDMRRRLQQRYEEAQRLTTQQPPDFRQIHDLLAECLSVDAGNTLYLDTLMANLRRRDAATPKTTWLGKLLGGWRRGGTRTESSGLAVGTDTRVTAEQSILRSAGDRLWATPRSPELLRSLAEAAEEANLDQTELRYWQLAAENAPSDAEIFRGLASTLSRQGRFEEAAAEWQKLLAVAPSDAAAGAALAVLKPAAGTGGMELVTLRQSYAGQSGNVELGLRLTEALIAAEQFSEADKILGDVLGASGGDLRVLEQREKLQLAKSSQRVAIARRWAASDANAKAKRLVGQLEGEHQRLEIEIWNARTERMPKDWSVRVELARRLKQVGNYSGAIQRLEEAQRLKVNHPGALIELGECWQHLRQFEKALELYEKAVSKAASLSSNDEVLKLARYRAAVLAAALGQREFARQNLTAILGADPEYKDARQRLDKLGSN